MKSIIEQASSIIKAIEKAWNQADQPKEFSIKIFEKEERNFFGMSTKPAKIGIFFGDKQIIHEKPVQKPRPEIKECRPATAKSPINPPASSKSIAETTLTTRQNATENLLKRGSHSACNKEWDYTKDIPAEKTVTSNKAVQKNHTNPQQEPLHVRTSPTQQKPLQRHQKPIAEKLPSASATPKEKPHRVPTAWSEAMIHATHEWLTKALHLMGMKAISFNSEVTGRNLKIIFSASLVADALREKQLFRSFAHLIISSLRNQYKQEIKDLKVILISTSDIVPSHTGTSHREI